MGNPIGQVCCSNFARFADTRLNKNSIESLKMARSRFRKVIREAEAPDAEFFLQMLEMKKRPQAGTKKAWE